MLYRSPRKDRAGAAWQQQLRAERQYKRMLKKSCKPLMIPAFFAMDVLCRDKVKIFRKI